jgi:hypothetical protein
MCQESEPFWRQELVEVAFLKAALLQLALVMGHEDVAPQELPTSQLHQKY